MAGFHIRKAYRTWKFENYRKGLKLIRCTACNGTGVYDSLGSPPCAACDGKGKIRQKREVTTIFLWEGENGRVCKIK